MPEDSSFGRLINHSVVGGVNLRFRIVTINNTPVMIFTSTRDIEEGEELYYDYGREYNADILKDNHWLMYDMSRPEDKKRAQDGH